MNTQSHLLQRVRDPPPIRDPGCIYSVLCKYSIMRLMIFILGLCPMQVSKYNLSSIWLLLLQALCVWVYVWGCVCVWECAHVWMSDWMCMCVCEMETAFGFGALLWHENKKNNKSPQVTDGNFSGPTMLQSISLHSTCFTLFDCSSWFDQETVELGIQSMANHWVRYEGFVSWWSWLNVCV